MGRVIRVQKFSKRIRVQHAFELALHERAHIPMRGMIARNWIWSSLYTYGFFFWQRLVFISLHYVERLRTSIYIYGTQKTIIITCRHNSIPTFKPVSTHIYNIIYYIRTHFSPSHFVYHIIAFYDYINKQKIPLNFVLRTNGSEFAKNLIRFFKSLILLCDTIPICYVAQSYRWCIIGLT